ncbi:MAG: hypothetical protein EOM25_08360 [Deltaproteobacteria bacterium]|nr:hypothetical protein [Deltaproteobacteria bacterium]
MVIHEIVLALDPSHAFPMSSARRARTVAMAKALSLAAMAFAFLVLVWPRPAMADLDTDYERAIEDAKQADPDEISRNLWAIVPSNGDLIWEGEPGESRLLVVTWASPYFFNTFYKGREGQEILLPVDYNAWVTVVPELKDFFKTRNQPLPVNEQAADLRIKQLLGLYYTWDFASLVQIWVYPQNLFRPSADPEITDHEAELDYPTTGNRFLAFGPATITEYKQPPRDFQGWFEFNKIVRYEKDGYWAPWTRLGYTYDWNNATDEFGLSEFILLGNSTVKIESCTPEYEILGYFTPPDSGGSSSGGCLATGPNSSGDPWPWLFLLIMAFGWRWRWKTHRDKTAD